MADYTTDQLYGVLEAVGLEAGDVVYCHSNIGIFGSVENINGREALCTAYFDAIFRRIGPTGTLIVPTYTYSFGAGADFEAATSASKMGMFAEWVRLRKDSVRSEDPMFSISAVGRDPERFTAGIPANSFAENSTFARFHAENGKMLCLNHPGCTFLHFVERTLKLPYRFDKNFTGRIMRDGVLHPTTWTSFVRYMNDELLAHDPWPFVKAIKANGKAQWASLGRGEVLAISARDIFDTVADETRNYPWLLTRAHDAGRIPVIDVTATGPRAVQDQP